MDRLRNTASCTKNYYYYYLKLCIGYFTESYLHTFPKLVGLVSELVSMLEAAMEIEEISYDLDYLDYCNVPVRNVMHR
jgi:hypothetical protein